MAECYVIRFSNIEFTRRGNYSFHVLSLQKGNTLGISVAQVHCLNVRSI